MSNAQKKQNQGKDICDLKITCTGVGWQMRNSACNKTLIVNPSDIRKRLQSDKKDYVYGITCPNCGCFTVIPNNKIPGSVRKMLYL